MQIYVHFPFCKSKCAYCDFNSYAGTEKSVISAYLSALIREIRLAGEQYQSAKIDTVYFGGGTPSMLDERQLTAVSEAIFKSFKVDKNSVKEFTVECNPESVDYDKLAALREMGATRVSIGVQSLFDDNLKSVGRIHTAADARKALRTATEVFRNVSADIIVGLPYDDEKRVRSEARELASLVNHISAYCLILEEGTPLWERANYDEVWLPSDDETEDLFTAVREELKASGFERYEISNFAKDGAIGVHNYGYWTREEYLGFGAGAHSLVKTHDGVKPLEKEIRFASPCGIHAYIAGVNCAPSFDGIPRTDMEILDEAAVRYERVMLGLRTAKGIDASLISQEKIKRLERYFSSEGERVALNDDGMSVMNAILAEIL